MIAVPVSWVDRSKFCSGQDLDSLRFSVGYLRARCVNREVSSLRQYKRGQRWPHSVVNGLTVRASEGFCRTSRPPICSLAFSVPSEHVYFSMTFRGMDATKVLSEVVDSVQPIPAGYAAVPLIELGWPVDRAERVLKAAGFIGVAPEATWPHYATGTDPAAGTVLPKQIKVALTIGDG